MICIVVDKFHFILNIFQRKNNSCTVIYVCWVSQGFCHSSKDMSSRDYRSKRFSDRIQTVLGIFGMKKFIALHSKDLLKVWKKVMNAPSALLLLLRSIIRHRILIATISVNFVKRTIPPNFENNLINKTSPLIQD